MTLIFTFLMFRIYKGDVSDECSDLLERNRQISTWGLWGVKDLDDVKKLVSESLNELNSVSLPAVIVSLLQSFLFHSQ